jgi:hypothetical protein
LETGGEAECTQERESMREREREHESEHQRERERESRSKINSHFETKGHAEPNIKNRYSSLKRKAASSFFHLFVDYSDQSKHDHT